MPSGSKKRKAAKKKKEQTAHTISSSTNNCPYGNDDPRSQDERDSDDHNQHHTFIQGEDEGKILQSHVTEKKYVEEATKDTESTEKSRSGVVDIKIEKVWELKNDLESTHVSIQHVELDKSSSSSSGKSSCSSSDDEPQVSEKKSMEEDCNIGSEMASYNTENKLATILAEDVPKVAEHGGFENGDSYSTGDIVAIDNTVKTALSLPEVSETSEKNSVPDVVEPGLKANEEKLLSSSNEISGVELEGTEGKKFTLEPREYSEKQPLVASTPPQVQRTSFLSCCGLFEAFTGSGR